MLIQPARGYNLDPKATYHDPALVPPHAYLAAYAWLADEFRADAVIDLGKHGTLEWLPGKALALSAECFPEAVLGPLPHLYPFIVNDPGEGTQAKRRAQAVIVDHLTPPLTRAGSYGQPAELERLIDEYYEAARGDPRRIAPLAAEILERARAAGIDRDCGIAPDDDRTDALQKLDGFLCELKELQIRDGLHVFGAQPRRRAARFAAGRARPRPPRRSAPRRRIAAARARRRSRPRLRPADRRSRRALDRATAGGASSLSARGRRRLGEGRTASACPAHASRRRRDGALPLPDGGEGAGLAHRRRHGRAAGSAGAAADLRRGEAGAGLGADARRARLDRARRCARRSPPAARREIAGLLAGLDGRFVLPGPSGAPSRGRPEVLPTGRNFYSLDTRAVPTPAAWQLGWHSAGLLVERHAQEHGNYPARVALSAWGTANMRTGGDDIAQALALIGARPVWEPASGRVTGFEILPACVLDRPRVDVTLRISGFFRDAFPGLIDLFDSAVRAVAALDEPAAINPLAARVAADRAALEAAGAAPDDAARRAGYRIFGVEAGRLWRRAADADRRAHLAGRRRSRRGLSRLGRLCLWRRRRGHGRARPARSPARRASKRCCTTRTTASTICSTATTTTSSRAGSRSPCGICRGARRRSITTTIRSPTGRASARLREEFGRVVRGRAANPRWIAGVMRHGYKGAAEIAATVDYLFAFAATARAVDDAHFEALYDAYLGDDAVREFIAGANPAALAEIRARFAEAIERGLWRPKRNSIREALAAMSDPPTPKTRSTPCTARRWRGARRRATGCWRPRPRSAASSSSIPAPARANRPPRSAWCCAASATACGSASCSSSRAPGTPASATCWRSSPISSPAARWARASPGTPRTAPATSPPRAPPGRWRRR